MSIIRKPGKVPQSERELKLFALCDWEWSASSPGELHPEALPEPDVSLSTHPAPLPRPRSSRLPVDKPVGLTLRSLLQPMLGALPMASQLLVLALHPADQHPIQMLPEGMQRRRIELAVILHSQPRTTGL